MSEPRGPLREIAWRDLFPGLLLLRCFRLALDLRKLILAAVGLVLTIAGWHVIARLAPAEARLAELTTLRAPDLDAAAPADPATPAGADRPANPLADPWRRLSEPFRRIFAPDLHWRSVAALTCAAIWAALVWALFGGAITRMAAIQLTREQRYSVGRALGFARGRLAQYAAAPLLPLAGVAIAVVLGGLIPGLLLRAGGAGVFLVGLFWWLLLLLVGLTLAILLFGLLFGWPLLWGAISVEGSDAFDAVSRAYSYTFQRPLHYLGYAIVAAALGALGVLVVTAFAFLVVYLTTWTVSWGSGAETMAALEAAMPSRYEAPPPVAPASPAAEPRGSLAEAGLRLMGLANDGVALLALGFAYSFFWTAATAIYLLLRLSADATELDEIYLEDPLDDAQLPALRTDAAGVAVLAEEQE